MLFVGCDDEAFEDALSPGLRRLETPHGNDENSPHKAENTEAERAA